MYESLAPFVTYALALGIAGAIPGPGIAAVVGRSLGSQRHSPIPFIFGIALGDIVFLTIAVLGLSVVAQVFAGVFTAIKLAGGLYLLYLAWKFWTAKIEDGQIEKIANQRPIVSILSGLAISLGNPKVIVFYLALLPNVIDLTTVAFIDWMVLSLLTFGVLFIVLLPYSYAASKLRGVFSNSMALRRLNRGASLFIGGAGALILSDTVRGR
jgi:threonine/homoserine/homoserine lactone efflux protein